MNEPRQSPFGNTLRRLREEAALTQEELAERAGLSVRGVSDLERGARTTPRLETVRMLATGLRLDEVQQRELLDARQHTRTPGGHSGRVMAVPTPVTSFIGREQQIATLGHMLQHQQFRLITLLGPGGVGKTRIAIEVAHRLADVFADGVVFVDLSVIRHPDLVLPGIARRLTLSEHVGHDLREALLVALQGRHLLLVLDNLEQVIDAATDIAWLHGTFPDLAIIVTSRVRLRITCEQVVDIEPLAIVADQDGDGPHPIEAVSLFMDRARAVVRNFELTDENTTGIEKIVATLQGMPLAIELAAARIRMLPVTELLGRLNTQLPVLGGGARDAPLRQRTMRDTISWSYNLLSETERAVFRTLAIFPDGCTLETAVVILGVDGRLDEPATLAAMETLVDSSLLRHRKGPDGLVRFRMLQTIREFGLEQLASASEEALVRFAAHVAWSAPLVHEAEFVLSKPGPELWLDRIGAEYQNLRDQVSWLIEHDDVEDALDISMALATFSSIRGHLEDSRGLLELLLGHPRLQTPTIERMRGLIALGILCKYQADAMRSFVALQESAQLARELDQLRHIPVALYNLAIAMFDTGRDEDAEALFNEVVALAQENTSNFTKAAAYRKLARLYEYRGQLDQSHLLALESLKLGLAEGHTWNVALAKLFLGEQLVLKGDLDQAERLTLDAKLLLDQLGNRALSPYMLAMLANVARHRHDLDRAEELLEEALDTARELGIRREIALILWGLGHIAFLKGTMDPARVYALRAIEWYEQFGDVFAAIRCIELAADLALRCGDACRASWCMGAFEAVSVGHGMQPLSYEAGGHQRRIDSVMAQLSKDDWHEHHDRALAMSEEEILAEAKAWLSPRVSPAARGSTSR